MRKIAFFILTMLLNPLIVNADDGISVKKIKDNIYFLVSPQGGNVVAFTGSDGTFIIDDQLSHRSEIINNAIKNIDERGVKFILNTHFHFDHTGTNEFFGEKGAVIVAHDNVRKRLSSEQFITYFKKKMPPLSKAGLPAVTFANNMSLHYNDNNIKMIHTPHAHTDGDAAAYFANENIVAAGDLIFNGLYPFIDTEHGGSIKGLIAALDTLLELTNNKTIIAPGHGPLMNKSDLLAYRNMLAKITSNIENALKDGKTLEQIIATKPTKDFDSKIATTLITADAFVSVIYADLTR